MNKISFIFAIIVASASSYNFLNGDRLIELPINRFKRDEEGPPHCCGNDFSGNPVLFLGEVSQECLPKIVQNDGTNDIKKRITEYICVGDCIATNEGTVQNGEVNREKVMEFLRNHDQDEYRIQVFEENLDKCIIEAKQVKKRIAGKIKCDSTAIALKRCLDRELYVNCPKDKQNVNRRKKCSEMKQSSRVNLDGAY